ncbi:metalloprotease m41 ftsh [Culex quinquefasciatus]|uniref:Metalloprotease m41 ftsh n=1 Tax=Culex quinquefasciatus TaxID=7176 RepID=B0XKN4_CULQU|nr:metalloprotease m41 ftsh [Culex quinquefasciatus]|eukprot:XP_001870206.1 metalloprotease m41 ftsh [Culex quinquefasciatus]
MLAGIGEEDNRKDNVPFILVFGTVPGMFVRLARKQAFCISFIDVIYAELRWTIQAWNMLNLTGWTILRRRCYVPAVSIEQSLCWHRTRWPNDSGFTGAASRTDQAIERVIAEKKTNVLALEESKSSSTTKLDTLFPNFFFEVLQIWPYLGTINTDQHRYLVGKTTTGTEQHGGLLLSNQCAALTGKHYAGILRCVSNRKETGAIGRNREKCRATKINCQKQNFRANGSKVEKTGETWSNKSYSIAHCLAPSPRTIKASFGITGFCRHFSVLLLTARRVHGCDTDQHGIDDRIQLSREAAPTPSGPKTILEPVASSQNPCC